MSYFITPDLGLELADPLTIQPFETVNVNSNFLLLEAGIVADRVRLGVLEADVETLQDRVVLRVADFTALAAASTAELLSGDLAYVTEGDVFMFWDGSAPWRQLNVATFGSTAARDTAYAKASAAYLVTDARALIGFVEYRYAGAWLRVPNVVAAGTFTAQSTINIDSLNGYEIYELTMFAPTSSVANAINMRFRAGGATVSTALYDSTVATDTGAAGAWGSGAAGTVFLVGPGDRLSKRLTATIIGMNAANETDVETVYRGFDVGVNQARTAASHRFRGINQFDGVSLYTSAGTITGSYWVRGVA